jgi:hypothetical protein
MTAVTRPKERNNFSCLNVRVVGSSPQKGGCSSAVTLCLFCVSLQILLWADQPSQGVTRWLRPQNLNHNAWRRENWFMFIQQYYISSPETYYVPWAWRHAIWYKYQSRRPSASCRFLASLTFLPWRWRQFVLPKRTGFQVTGSYNPDYGTLNNCVPAHINSAIILARPYSDCNPPTVFPTQPPPLAVRCLVQVIYAYHCQGQDKKRGNQKGRHREFE